MKRSRLRHLQRIVDRAFADAYTGEPFKGPGNENSFAVLIARNLILTVDDSYLATTNVRIEGRPWIVSFPPLDMAVDLVGIEPNKEANKVPVFIQGHGGKWDYLQMSIVKAIASKEGAA